MNRILNLQKNLLRIINEQEGKIDCRDESLDWERIHMASSARVAFFLAIERGADPELSACAATVHDFGRILTGVQKGHAEAGFEPVRRFLSEIGLFSEDEIEIISMAVKNHSNKTSVGTLIEEIVKDADVIDCYQYGYPFDRPEKEERYKKWKECH
ncbi:MAG: HD domain-containing protein [Eubacteriales bacterium]|jgi:uncharacterized protein|nr:HD domain-containing protein [Eubacteriales bacterium]